MVVANSHLRTQQEASIVMYGSVCVSGMYKNKVAVSMCRRQQPRKHAPFPPWKIVRWASKLSWEKKRLVVELVESRNKPAGWEARGGQMRVHRTGLCSAWPRLAWHEFNGPSLQGIFAFL